MFVFLYMREETRECVVGEEDWSFYLSLCSDALCGRREKGKNEKHRGMRMREGEKQRRRARGGDSGRRLPSIQKASLHSLTNLTFLE